MIKEEEDRIKKIGQEIHKHIDNNQIGKAKKLLKEIERSFLVSEAEDIIIPALSKIQLAENKPEEAKATILAGICYCWGNDAAFEILRRFNPSTDKNSKLYYLEVKGGQACFGAFTKFSQDHIGSFELVANNVAEALVYVDQICNFAQPKKRAIIYSAMADQLPVECKQRGIYTAYPFRLDGQDRAWAA